MNNRTYGLQDGQHDGHQDDRKDGCQDYHHCQKYLSFGNLALILQVIFLEMG